MQDKNLLGKSILVVYQPHRYYKGGLLEYLVNALKTTGLQVEYLDILGYPKYTYSHFLDKIKNIYHRIIHKDKQYILKLENDYINKFYLKKLRDFKKKNTKTYDFILVIKPEEFSPIFMRELKPLGKSLVGYIWDGLRLFLKPNLDKNKKYIEHIYSFDKNNIREHQDLHLEFCTNFLFPQSPESRVPYESRATDIFYVGDLGGTLEIQRRDKKLVRLLKNISGKMDINIWLPESAKDRISKIDDKNIKYIYDTISIFESIERTKNAKIVIDICKGHHIGLSFRFFECLACDTKIITNNMDIVNYDFYNPNNILVVDFDKDTLSYEDFRKFIDLPYQSISPDIIEKYSIANWVKYLFKFNEHINID